MDVAEGQWHDAHLAEPVLADKGFDADSVLGFILEGLDALPVIPNKRNRREPWPWGDTMADAYRDRNRLERGFGKAKQFRGLSTRYEKLKDVYLGSCGSASASSTSGDGREPSTGPP